MHSPYCRMDRRPFDEMRAADGAVRPHFGPIAEWLAQTPARRVAEKRREADLLFHRVGITFAVYGDEAGAERLIPFDTIPRILPKAEWDELARGLRQRVTALNLFLHDIYHEQAILKAGVVPREQVLGNASFQAAMRGVDLPNRVYSHIAGIDLVRHSDGKYYVLEDNLRTPSGVSYMIENRKMMMRLFPELFERQTVLPVEHYPALLLETLRASASPRVRDPVVAVLTPGPHNSAYFEHAFLAQWMGVELVEGADLLVRDNFVYMRTTGGRQRVDVIYRRIDDAFLDPEAFRRDSLLGVPGLFAAYRAGNVALANAVGTGVADDKSTYPYVPEMIRFYLGEEPILKNVPTWRCREPKHLAYVLDHLLHAEDAEDEERRQVNERHEEQEHDHVRNDEHPVPRLEADQEHPGSRPLPQVLGEPQRGPGPQCDRGDAPDDDRHQHRPGDQPQHARVQEVDEGVGERRDDPVHLRILCHRRERRFAETGTGVLSSCAKSDTRSSSSSQPNCSSSPLAPPRRARTDSSSA